MEGDGDTMTALRKPIPGRMTVAEFLEWDSGDVSGRLWQLVDGSPVAMAPASQTHGAIQSEIAYRITDHFRKTGSKCRVITAPGVIPRRRSSTNYRIPDLGVTCAPPNRDHAMTEPLVLIEILSPSNVAETRLNLGSYQTVPSVAEILLVSSFTVSAELLRKGSDGAWPDQPEALAADDVLELRSIGFSVTLRDLYQATVLA